MNLSGNYKKARKITHPWVNSFGLLLKELWISIKTRFSELLKLGKVFLNDFNKYGWSENWQYKTASIISIVIVGYLFIWLPGASLFDKARWKVREFNIHYTERRPVEFSQVEKEIQQFATDYTKAFGTDCDWFRKRAVDIAMWQKYKKVEYPTYECANFNKYSRTLLFPIRIGNMQDGEFIQTLEVRFGKVEYNDDGANRYTSVDSKLWRIKDDGLWRINNMNNSQRYDFPQR